jgi:hypothetical protein
MKKILIITLIFFSVSNLFATDGSYTWITKRKVNSAGVEKYFKVMHQIVISGTFKEYSQTYNYKGAVTTKSYDITSYKYLTDKYGFIVSFDYKNYHVHIEGFGAEFNPTCTYISVKSEVPKGDWYSLTAEQYY